MEKKKKTMKRIQKIKTMKKKKKEDFVQGSLQFSKKEEEMKKDREVENNQNHQVTT